MFYVDMGNLYNTKVMFMSMKNLTLLLFVALCQNLFAQTFSVSPKEELEKWQGAEYYDYDNRFQSASKTIVPMRLKYSKETEDSVLLLVIDSTLKDNKLYFKRPRKGLSAYEDLYYGAEMPGGEVLLKSQFYIYRTQKQENELHLKKKIRLRNSYNFISRLDGISKNKVVLANTYNNSYKGRPYDNIRVSIFNMGTRRTEKSVKVDIGKGILLSHYGFNMIAKSDDYIAVSSPLKGEVYIMNNKLNVIDTVKINYSPILHTEQLLDSILPDKVLLENYGKAYLNLQIMSEYKIYLKPKIDKIAFVGNDLLFIMVHIDEAEYSGKHIDFVYSVKSKKFRNSNGVINGNNDLMSSQQILFNGTSYVTIDDSLGNDGIYHYYYTTSTIEDYNPDDAPVLSREKYPPISSLETIFDTTGIQYSYKDFDYIMFTDVGSCSHCRFGSSYGKIMVIHVEENLGALSLSNKNLHKKKYELMFNSPKVFFAEKKILDPSIKINCIYKIDKR